MSMYQKVGSLDTDDDLLDTESALIELTRLR